MDQTRKIIGIVGGVGPYAGLDLNRKIFDNTLTGGTDQEHLETVLFSAGTRIPDRTEFLLGRAGVNPALGLFEALAALEAAGAAVAAIACNTAHAVQIIGPLKEKMEGSGLKIKLLDMIEETGRYIRERFGPGARAGLLATEGTVRCGVYGRLEREMSDVSELITPDEEILALVHRAIYDRDFGIKARSNPVTAKAIADCKDAVAHLKRRGAQFVILGCTELPLALPGRKCQGVELLDPTEITARALVREVAPARLRPVPDLPASS